ncbi:phage tail protein [Acidocella sp.]|uniref:phage tail protein n=1 Tax=Acidocella sp. TaxID=50710 RepID=UPI00261E4150|nr:phage tail protein [Acidocella sp.]
MPIVQQSAINTTALVVPDLYVQIVPPQSLLLNGVPTDIVGVVGTASWGPVGEPVVIGSMNDYAAAFGPVMARKYDLGTQIATAVQQGAANFRCVRVTDGTDSAASLEILGAVIFTAAYTGSTGNGLIVTLGNGSAANSWRLTITLPGQSPEIFDNLSGSGAQFWDNLANAVNNGNGVLRGPSQLVVASAQSVQAVPVSGSYPFSAGTPGSDGANSVTAATLIGNDTPPRRGMYALRNQGCAIGLLADADDPASWSVQMEMGLSESMYMILTGPAGDTIDNAVIVKGEAGIDSYAAKMMFGDWIYWNDLTNSVIRLVSPQGFVAGRLANLSPEQSSLNKQVYGAIGTQKSGQPGGATVTSYASADLETLLSAGIDVIANPQPGGAYWGVRGGHNSSSSAAVNGDNYTRLTNYIAATLQAGMGGYVGQLVNSTLFQNIRATLLSYLNGLLQQGILGRTDGSLPFTVVCDVSNNPPSRTALGYVQADVQIRYQAINEKFIVNVQGGQTVQVSVQTSSTAPING